jgi:hypothetical protein
MGCDLAQIRMIFVRAERLELLPVWRWRQTPYTRSEKACVSSSKMRHCVTSAVRAR